MAAVTWTAGCADSRREQPGDGYMNSSHTRRTDADPASAHYLLSAVDLEKFQPGGTKREILEGLNWRGNFSFATEDQGTSVTAISFGLTREKYSESKDIVRSADGADEVVWAVFIDDKFVKFVSPPMGEGMEIVVDDQGTPRSRPKPIKVTDYSLWLKGARSEAVNIFDLYNEVKARPPQPVHTDPELTAAWLLLREKIEVASEEDYRRNAELRDQFNAARLKMGMTEEEVEAVLKAEPIRSGDVEGGSYRIYGSQESFNIVQELHYLNVLVVYREEKVVGVRGLPGGSYGLQKLGQTFSDLPAP